MFTITESLSPAWVVSRIKFSRCSERTDWLICQSITPTHFVNLSGYLYLVPRWHKAIVAKGNEKSSWAFTSEGRNGKEKGGAHLSPSLYYLKSSAGKTYACFIEALGAIPSRCTVSLAMYNRLVPVLLYVTKIVHESTAEEHLLRDRKGIDSIPESENEPLMWKRQKFSSTARPQVPYQNY